MRSCSEPLILPLDVLERLKQLKPREARLYNVWLKRGENLKMLDGFKIEKSFCERVLNLSRQTAISEYGLEFCPVQTPI